MNFEINQRFYIAPAINLVTDKQTGKEHRIEPRLMQLLCILSNNVNQLITREELIAEIWKNYGGGDEGLTQAVSNLRKTFLDINKEMIQTIPKKGYVFKAIVHFESTVPNPATGDSRKVKKKWFYLAGPVLFIVTSFLLYQIITNNSEKAVSKDPTVTEYPDSFEKQEKSIENESNTITTRHQDTIFKLVLLGDAPPKFYINNKQLATHQWDPYLKLIRYLERKLIEKNRK